MRIVCNDAVFAEALQIALRTAGISTEILSIFPAPTEDSEGWIVDLDCIPSYASLPSRAVTFSSSPELQADLVRPFLFREMISLVKERFGNATAIATPPQTIPDGAVPFIKLLPDGVLLRGNYLALSPAEHALLALLLEYPGECVPADEIDALWQEKGGNTTAVYIRYLRKKIDEPLGLRLIRTIRGRGYCLCLPD